MPANRVSLTALYINARATRAMPAYLLLRQGWISEH